MSILKHFADKALRMIRLTVFDNNTFANLCKPFYILKILHELLVSLTTITEEEHTWSGMTMVG